MANDLFPMDGGKKPPKPPKPRVSIQLEEEEDAELEFVVEVWNQMNKVLGRQGRGWAAMSVAKRMVVVGIETFIERHGGHVPWPRKDGKRHPPMTTEERAALLRRALAEIKKQK